jgi:phosphatidate cytidylyltransferase
MVGKRLKTDFNKSSVFVKRTIISVIGVPAVAAIIWFGDPWFTLFGVLWGVMAAREFYGLLKRSKGVQPLTYFGLLWVVLFIISPHSNDLLPLRINVLLSLPFLLLTAVVAPLVILLGRGDKQNAFANWVWTAGGILYIGFLLRYMVELRMADEGRGWVALAVLCTFASDITAYLVGKAIGKHKMAPYISPNKTWEGAAGGLLGAVIVSVIVSRLFSLTILGAPMGYGYAVILGMVISAAGQTGDMVKSLFKRNMAVKDSSNAIPGHGGFLDRMDSMAFAGVAAYYLWYFLNWGIPRLIS